MSGESTRAGDRRHRRVRVIPKGPVMVEGPVDIERPDGSTMHCDRFQVAICACGCSGTPPLCDATHRRLPGPSPDRPTQKDPQKE
ncbi:CDGSH iron-sulfur domain-containing protein [Gordonia humi]|uniref:CDGSH iron-sulfur domain-containing protein n=1 Tax=Gordonia humi TaxID=686429 RepID=UPI0016099F93|nr:CDGSH iron-sulfur domain-containing protein [Gordonia humi]